MPPPLPSLLALAFFLALAPSAFGQARPYIGFVYPAGGQQGTTFRVKLGGQNLDPLEQVLVTGAGVSARLIEYFRPLNPQEMQLLNEQLRELKRRPARARTGSGGDAIKDLDKTTESSRSTKETVQAMIARIEQRTREYCNRPQSRSLAGLAFVEFTIAPDAPPGQRELRVRTLRGLSNPMVFHVGQIPEFTRKPMPTSNYQLLGKEELALRKRPADEVEQRIQLPCTMNGQVASGEVNRYRFDARKRQRLVITTQARQLIPYLADAVPGWFQPVLALHDAHGKELAYNDDFRFKPDPVILFEVPSDGEYVLSIHDSIYRGREDFVYRISIGELPFLTGIFPLGGRLGKLVNIEMNGWNLEEATIIPPAHYSALRPAAADVRTADSDASTVQAGIHTLAARRAEFVSNPLLFALDTLPESLDQEPNNSPSSPQKIALPVIINGRIDQTGDWDVFQFSSKNGATVVAEAQARQLDSPLDSVIKLTDAGGNLLAFSDDVEDLGDGLNTHHADSYFMAKLPADGIYFLHIGDTARKGGDEFGYRLRISPPRPDFALRAVPSSLALRSRGTAPVTLLAIRKDGFTGPIKLQVTDPPGFSSAPVTLSGTRALARLTVKTSLAATEDPVNLVITGAAKIQGQDIVRNAMPAEDRMQAFLWRHLVPASELKILVYNPSYQPPLKRVPPQRPPADARQEVAASDRAPAKPQFTKQQVATRLRQLRLLFEEWLMTDEFYDRKVAECDAAL